MRIALYHNLPSGGAKRAVYEWTRRLSTAHEFDVYTLTTADHTFCDIRPFVRDYRISEFVPRRLFRRPFGRLNQLQRWLDLGSLERIGRRIGSEMNMAGYDVVFAQPCRYTSTPSLLRFVEVPSIYYLHEAFGRAVSRQFGRPYIPKKEWRTLLDRVDPLIAIYGHRLEGLRVRCIGRTTRLLANSQFTRQQMKLGYDVDAPVCYLGVNTEDFKPDPDMEKENLVISVGELAPRKGFDFLIESLAQLPSRKRPTLELACNWEDAAERRYIEELAVHRGVELHVLTNLNAKQLAAEYSRARVCVYAPLQEPFGLVPLESMACGTPVVGVAEGGVRENVVDGVTGTLVGRDEAQFAQAVGELLEDDQRRTRYGQQGREHVLEHWTWEAAVARLERHLVEVATGGE